MAYLMSHAPSILGLVLNNVFSFTSLCKCQEKNILTLQYRALLYGGFENTSE